MLKLDGTCEDCYNSDLIFCDSCESLIEACMNCVFYSNIETGYLCDNCISFGLDEGVCFGKSVEEIQEWVFWNNNLIFFRKFVLPSLIR